MTTGSTPDIYTDFGTVHSAYRCESLHLMEVARRHVDTTDFELYLDQISTRGKCPFLKAKKATQKYLETYIVI
jgi:hypothetical protein